MVLGKLQKKERNFRFTKLSTTCMTLTHELPKKQNIPKPVPCLSKKTEKSFKILSTNKYIYLVFKFTPTFLSSFFLSSVKLLLLHVS